MLKVIAVPVVSVLEGEIPQAEPTLPAATSSAVRRTILSVTHTSFSRRILRTHHTFFLAALEIWQSIHL